MATSYLTSSTLIDSVKRRESIPTAQVTFSDDDFLAFANEEMSIGLVPAIMIYHQEFLVNNETLALVDGQQAYPIPSRAIGSRLRNLYYQDSQGNLREMSRIQPEDIVMYQNQFSQSAFVEFYLQDNNIVLITKVQSPTGSLVFSYFLRPNKLVSEERVGIITGITPITIGSDDYLQYTLDQMPDVFNLTSSCDIVQQQYGHKTKVMDVLPQVISTSTKTVTFLVSDLPTNIIIGDHIALSGETIIPQVPDELHSVLAQRVACRCLESLGDAAGLQAAMGKLQEMEFKMGTLLDNRTEGNPAKVVNMRGLLRNGRFGRRRSYF